MKKMIIALMTGVVLLVSCHTQTPQERAENFAADYIKKQLYFPDTFAPIAFVMDTAYAPIETPETIEMLKKFMNLYNRIDEAEREVKSKERRYEMHKGMGAYNSYAAYEIKEAKAEFDKAQEQYDAMLAQLQAYTEEMQEMQAQPKTPYALKLVQAYKAQNNGGQTISSAEMLIVDFDMTKVIYVLSEADLELVQSVVQDIQNKKEQNFSFE